MATGFGIRGGASDRMLAIRADEYNGFLKELREKLSKNGNGTTMQRVVDFEVGRVMERAVEKTGKADIEKIKVRVKNKSVFNIGGRKWGLRDWKTGKAWHVPNPIWGQMERIRALALSVKLGRVALSKKSWYWIAQKLGQVIAVPAYVANARDVPDGGPNNMTIERRSDGDKYGVILANNMPIVTFDVPNGRQALFTAIAGRIGAYKQNLAHGVFDDAKAIAKKYKGVLVDF